VRQVERALARISDRIVTISLRQRDDIVIIPRQRADQTVGPLGWNRILSGLPTPASARQALGLPSMPSSSVHDRTARSRQRPPRSSMRLRQWLRSSRPPDFSWSATVNYGQIPKLTSDDAG
jgi:hypothetical protein